MTRITRAIVLAAGLGLRLRPLTDSRPKALVEVGKRPLIDHALDQLAAGGVEEVVVNLHHHADMLATHLADRATPKITLSREPQLMGTGGGIRKALPLLGADPFFAVDCDTLRLDGPTPALRRMAEAWDPDRMDALILAAPTAKGIGMPDHGVLFLDPEGRARLPGESEIAPYAFASVQLLSPALVAKRTEEPFSYKELWRLAEAEGRLWGMVHDGACLQVLTPESVEEADALLDERMARWVEP
ncbi:MAG TPA: nucleotidyltransferase family protein [Azospirillaceae bacterium]|nr:nucleotidyltransferase family protein [Azospirillaceae bacterium]